MSFLTDTDISQFVTAAEPLAERVKNDGFIDKDSAVQACSLDLTVGEIYLPGTDDRKPGGAQSPRSSLSLKEGQTATIRTHELLRLPADIGAIGFPPSKLSINGLLMTNPGHVDPGYRGHLHFTVINMAKENIDLKRGDKIVTLLFFRLEKDVGAPYYQRRGTMEPIRGPISPELLNRLSPDFLNIEERARRAAGDAVVKTEFRTKVIAPLLAAVITAVAAVGITYFTAQSQIKVQLESQIRTLEQSIARLDGRIGGLGGNVNLGTLETRIKTLEDAQKPKP